MALTNSLASSLFPTIGPSGYQSATGAYQNGKNLIPIGSYKPAATTDWSNPMAGLGQDALTALQNGQPYVLPGGHYDPMGKSYGVITAGNMPGTGTGAISFNSTENGPGTTIDNPAMRGYSYIPMDGQQKNANDYWFNQDGSYNSAYQNTPIMGYAKGIGTVLGAALGFGAVGAAAGGATAAGAGAGAGAGESIGAANALSDAAAYNSLSPAAWESAGLGSTVAPSTGALGAGALSAGGGGGEVASSAAFNPAVDSQLASSQLGITGSQSALSAAEGAIPSVTVNGAANPSWLDALKSGASSLLGSSGGGVGDFNWTSLLGPALQAGGAVVGANATKSAADDQLQAAREAQAMFAPWIQAGGWGIGQAANMLGKNGADAAAAAFQQDPGYQFRLQQGENALTRAASANGTLGSGKYLKDAMAYNQGQASQEFGNSLNRLLGVAGMGQTATGSGADYLTQGANASAAGKIGGANAINNGLTQGYSMYSNNQLMNRLFPGSYQGVSNGIVS